jgi:positive regulator of sigma E activity
MNLLIIKIITNLLVMPLILMFVWNFLIPDILGLSSINFLQAVLLKILANILFKNYQSEYDKRSEEEEIRKDLLKLESFVEKYTERIRSVQYKKREKENE